MEHSEWINKKKRFVLFFDILGFKNMVSRNTHAQVVNKLNKINFVLNVAEGKSMNKFLSKHDDSIAEDQTKSFIFSDSIVFFSKGNSYADATKIIADAATIYGHCLRNKIPIKGSISFGYVTIDFNKSLFFGQPIIDAYLLHEELNMLSIVVDHNAEKKFAQLKKGMYNYDRLFNYSAFMKYGRVNHLLYRPNPNTLPQHIKNLEKIRLETSGKPRIYFDNTQKFFEALQLVDNESKNQK